MSESDGPNEFSVVIGDASEHVRQALSEIVEHHPGLRLAAAASNGDEATELCGTHRPHLAVIDLMSSSMYKHAHEAIRLASPGTIVAVHTARADRRTRERLLSSGVHAVFSKGVADDLGDALHALAASFYPDLAD